MTKDIDVLAGMMRVDARREPHNSQQTYLRTIKRVCGLGSHSCRTGSSGKSSDQHVAKVLATRRCCGILRTRPGWFGPGPGPSSSKTTVDDPITIIIVAVLLGGLEGTITQLDVATLLATSACTYFREHQHHHRRVPQLTSSTDDCHHEPRRAPPTSVLTSCSRAVTERDVMF